MKRALPQEASWVSVAIFALAGAIAGLYAGGILPAAFGACLGLALGGLAVPAVTQIGYVAASVALLYGATTCYTDASLTGFQAAQSASVTRSLPPGSTFDQVYTYLKQRHAVHLSPSAFQREGRDEMYAHHQLRDGDVRENRPARATDKAVVTADYDTRFLLRTFRFHTQFQFDKRDRLAHCSIRLLM